MLRYVCLYVFRLMAKHEGWIADETWRPSDAGCFPFGSLQCDCGGRGKDHPTGHQRCAHWLYHVTGHHWVCTKYEVLLWVPAEGHHEH